MASAALELIIGLKDNASGPIGKTAAAVTDLGNKSEHTHGLLSGMMTGIGFAAVNAGISLVSDGFHALGGFLGDGVEGMKAAALASAQTAAVLKSTGSAAGVTATQVTDLATSFSLAAGKSPFGDDLVQSAENMTLTFTNISKQVFPDVVKTSLDMAVALKSTPEAMAQMTGKALGSVAGITALRRVGVQFSDDQVKLATHLFETGKTVEYQRLVLGELAKEFGGSAEAAATADGGIGQFKDSMGELSESIVTRAMPLVKDFFGLLNSPDVMAGIQSVANGIVDGLGHAVDWVSGTAVPALRTAWDNISIGFTFNGVGGAIQAIIRDIGQFIPALQPVTDFIGRNFWTVWDSTANVIGIARDAFITFRDALSGNWVDASGILPFHQAVGEVGLALGEFSRWIGAIGSELAGGDWSGAFDTLTTGLTNFGTTIATTVSTWGGQFISWVPTAIADMQAALPGIWNAVSTWIVDQAAPLLTQVSVWGSQFVAWVPTAIADLQAALPGIWTAVSTWVTDTATTIGTTLVAWGSAFIAWIGPAIPGFLQAMDAFATGIGTAITTGVPIIVGKVSLWATELVAWIQRDALPKLQPAFDGFLATLGAQADRAKTVLSAKGNEAGIALVEGFKLGWANAPVETSNVMTKMAAEIDKNRPAIMIVMKAIGEAGIKSMTDSMNAQTAIQLPSVESQISVALLGFIPSLGIAAGKLGLSIAESWYKGANDQFQKLFPGLNALGTSMGKFLADGLNTAGSLIVSAATSIGKALMDGIAAGFGDLAGWVAGKVLRALGGAITLIRAGSRIQSPSKLWAEQIGEPLAQGIAVGIQAGADTMTAAATGAVRGALDAARAALTGATMPNPFAGIGSMASYSGAKDPLSYLAPSTREMPALIGYVQDLGNGLRLLGDQTPAVQSLGDGLTLLGDQWARQGAAMTDLAPRLPQLAAGFSGIADAAKSAAAATVRATDDMLDHIKLLGGSSLDGMGGFTGDTGAGGALSYLKGTGGLGGSADYAKQAGSDAGMGFGDGWKSGIEQIGPVFQDTTRLTFQQLHDVVLLPWQTQTNDFFSGAGFGFIGAASVGINSAGNGLTTSAGNVGGAAGAALVSSMRGNLGGVDAFVQAVNASLGNITREVTIHVKTVYDG